MKRWKPLVLRVVTIAAFLSVCGWPGADVHSGSLADIRERGVLRHLGIPYAHFVYQDEESIGGLDVELMQLFARHLGVRYQWIPTTWSEALGDLTGTRVRPDGDDVLLQGETEVRGDILANGLTILPWREKVVHYSVPTFPTGVWLMARADAAMAPIRPSGDFATDLQKTRDLLDGRSILALKNTCLDPDLYRLDETGAHIRLYTASENLGELAPAVIQGDADATLLDIPDALVALQKWPGKIKVIGPVSSTQFMGAAFAKSAPELLQEFNRFFQILWNSGAYHKLVKKYYPAVFSYFGPFFNPVRFTPLPEKDLSVATELNLGG